MPGYWVTVALIDIIGRFIIQLQGFFFMTLFMAILAGDYYNLRGTPITSPSSNPNCPSVSGYSGGNHIAFIVMYALTFFFANFGPNATTFIVPAELFPARLRSTCHGISAASGKAGAIIGAFAFLYAAQSPTCPDSGYTAGIGIQAALAILTATNGLGFFFTFLVPETNQKSLEELSGEAEEWAGEEGEEEEHEESKQEA